MTSELKKYSPLAALSLLFLALFALWLLLIRPYVDYLDDRYRYGRQLHKKHQSLTSLIRSKDEIRLKYTAMQNNRSLDKIFLADKKDVLAEAKLQGIIKRKINNAGCVLLQSAVLPGADNAAAYSIRLKLEVRGDIGAMYRLLHDLEYGRPVLRVENVELTKSGTRYGYANPTTDIHTVIELSAYVKV